MKRNNIGIAVLSLSAALLVAAHWFVPAPANAQVAVKERDYQVVTARITSGGTTMEQLATRLADRVERPVVDKTGLSGRFEFNLAFTPERMPDGTPPPGVPAIDPNGPGIFTAIQEQLGLKLQPSRVVRDTLIIDHVERPTPNP